ncbi:nuclear transport factor 2 family protein [Piscirickettsia litoralis]|uniref:SnoaL-like domain-containing protein n=1 Tax=Piscirickettsia litoralis TaxID=1891921 RepID=A0ABX3A3M2_9GAMM|nr:nuclear transport factor 2 family protein [Piscirickettsia litoralis]ODN43467.1 hypothetical protein BGC07_11720 [Piscirickettsia litoralis]
MINTSKAIVLAYWQAMQTNDFYQASLCLSEDFECYWPQSSELIRGRENFTKINTHYPANGPWTFTIRSLLADSNNQVVSDGTIHASTIKANNYLNSPP